MGPVSDVILIEIVDSPQRRGVLRLSTPITVTVHYDIQRVLEHGI